MAPTMATLDDGDNTDTDDGDGDGSDDGVDMSAATMATYELLTRVQ